MTRTAHPESAPEGRRTQCSVHVLFTLYFMSDVECVQTLRAVSCKVLLWCQARAKEGYKKTPVLSLPSLLSSFPLSAVFVRQNFPAGGCSPRHTCHQKEKSGFVKTGSALGTSFFPNCQHAYSLKSHGSMFVRDNGRQCHSWGTKTLFKLSVGPLLQSHRYCVAVEVAGRQAEAQSRTEAWARCGLGGWGWRVCAEVIQVGLGVRGHSEVVEVGCRIGESRW